tara:strand:- start:2706 stop:4379 length:1674 start_codon:yes stop_codon:yes gene_type:complete
MDTNSLLNESAGFNKKMSEESKGLVSKWEKTGLLEGIESDFERSSIATLLENQARELVKEASSTGTSANSEEWAGVALPLVRRIFSEIAAKEFVSVQPMNLPSGLVFYLDFKYGTAQPGFETGAGKDSQTDSVFGITETAAEASEGLYGAGRFAYSINETSSQALGQAAAGAAAASDKFTTESISLAINSANFSAVNYDSAFSASLSTANRGAVRRLTVANADLPGADFEGVRGFEITGTGISTYYPEYTKVNASGSSTVSFIVLLSDTTDATALTGVRVKYQKQPTDITRGDFEDTTAGGSDLGIPELNVELRSVPIVAKTRKLKAQWTPEFAQDLNAYHSIDAEAELTSMLSEYISQEIDLEILDMLLENALTEAKWSARIGFSWNGNAFTSSGLNANVERYTQQQWFQTLGTQIQRVSNQIHAKTMRGGANFMVVSPDVATIIESIPGYHSNGTGNEMQFAFGVSQVGSFANRYQVYKNPYMKENVILLGFKGSQFLETGAVYAPYIPLIMTPLVYDPTNFQPRKGVMTRYAKQMVRGEFYGKVICHGLEAISQ